MAKKHSSKTATEKSIQSSEPRVITYRGWKGINFSDAPLTWEPLETGPSDYQETDLPDNYFMVQNNLITTNNSAIETRPDSIVIGNIPDPKHEQFMNVVTMYKEYLFVAVVKNKGTNTEDSYIYYRNISDTSNLSNWRKITLVDNEASPTKKYTITDINTYEGKLVVLANDKTDNVGHVFLGNLRHVDGSLVVSAYKFSSHTNVDNIVAANIRLSTPTKLSYSNLTSPEDSDLLISDHETDTCGVRVELCYCYTTRFGSTLVSQATAFYSNLSPAKWSSAAYLAIHRNIDTVSYGGQTVGVGMIGCTGIDIYAREMENTDWVFIGHIDVQPNTHSWTYNWLGNMTDINQWVTAQLQIPNENTTQGPDAKYVSIHDSRLYYWGMKDKPYRLYIGGNPGAEFSIARGHGGAWIDIEPGSGYDIKGTAKWKTASGSNIVTILCGNENTNKVKRFNLVETDITITNEVTYKGYMYEDVSNVVGCNSRYGFGVFLDGLYTLSRYGLTVTTMAMEYNNQMRSTSVSELIEPIFSERMGNVLKEGNLVQIDNVIYMALGDPSRGGEPIGLGQVIFCYDTDLQAWWTFTHDQNLDRDKQEDPDNLIRIFPVDSEDYWEGLGAITTTQIRLYPTTGVMQPTVPPFDVLVETGELIPRMPVQAHNYIQQLEFRFDYLVTDKNNPTTILVEGTDYYGRMFTIEKKIAIDERHPFDDTVEHRNHVEWIRIDKLVESMRVRIKGKARFRLTHFNCKLYQQADTIGTPYGFDAADSYRSRHGGSTQIHHYIDSYNNLRRAIVT